MREHATEHVTELGMRHIADMALEIARQRELGKALRTNGHHALAEEAERFLLILKELESECAARLNVDPAPQPTARA